MPTLAESPRSRKLELLKSLQVPDTSGADTTQALQQLAAIYGLQQEQQANPLKLEALRADTAGRQASTTAQELHNQYFPKQTEQALRLGHEAELSAPVARRAQEVTTAGQEEANKWLDPNMRQQYSLHEAELARAPELLRGLQGQNEAMASENAWREPIAQQKYALGSEALRRAPMETDSVRLANLMHEIDALYSAPQHQATLESSIAGTRGQQIANEYSPRKHEQDLARGTAELDLTPERQRALELANKQAEAQLEYYPQVTESTLAHNKAAIDAARAGTAIHAFGTPGVPPEFATGVADIMAPGAMAPIHAKEAKTVAKNKAEYLKSIMTEGNKHVSNPDLEAQYGITPEERSRLSELSEKSKNYKFFHRGMEDPYQNPQDIIGQRAADFGISRELLTYLQNLVGK